MGLSEDATSFPSSLETIPDNDTNDVNWSDPRPAGHYPRFRDAPWYYISDKFGICGEQVDLEKAWPDNRKRPCHPDCWGDAFGEPSWY